MPTISARTPWQGMPRFVAPALLALIAVAATAQQPADDILAFRGRAMCAYVHDGRADLIATWLDPSRVGEMPYDQVYGKWLHSLGRTKDRLSVFRQERFYEAVKATAAMDGRLNADAPLSERDAELVRRWLAGDDTLAQIAGKPGQNLARIRAALLALEPVTRDVMVLRKGAPEAQEDLAYLVTLPLVVSERGRQVVAEIRQSSADADLTAACDRLLQELETGRQDYVRKVLVTLADGQKVGWLRKKLASAAATRLVVGPLLEVVGLGSIAGGPAGVVAALLLGYDVAMTVSGEHEAYPHARLAHFADAIKPGLSVRWKGLRAGLSAADREACDRFDMTSQTAILLAALVNDEAQKTQAAYQKAMVTLGEIPTMQPVEPEVFQRVYQQWLSGQAFIGHAPALARHLPAGSGEAPMLREPVPEPTVPSLGETWNLGRN